MTKRKAKVAVEWQDTTLMTSPIPYALCTTEAAFKELLESIEYEDSWLLCGADATTHCLSSEDTGQQVIVIAIAPDKFDNIEDAYAALVHEAVHVWQFIRKSIGERKPGVEQEAYSIQHIAANLMHSYRKQTT